MNQQCSLSVITSIFPYYKYDRRVLFDKYFSMKIAAERISKPRKMNRKEINILRQRISKHVTLSTLHMLLIFKVQLRYVLHITAEYYVEMLNSCLKSRLWFHITSKCILGSFISSSILVALAIDSLILCISYVGINLAVFVSTFWHMWDNIENALQRH